MNRPPNDDAPDGSALYVINLVSSTMPMSLNVPFRRELVGFTVFRSRSFEHGREHFSLHLGYFESAPRAEEALSVVRKHYPDAWISAAPQSQLGSLDNTANTEFGLLRTAYARVVTPASAPKAPAPVAAKVASAPKAPAPVAAKVAGAPTAPAPVAAKVARAVVKEPTAGNRAAAPTVQAPQHYAVQLEWSPAPIIDIPRLAIFKEYHLYTVRVLREGSPQQGLRLGFFTSAEAAFRVAEYVRPEFPGVGVVPVSHREYSRAMELTRRRR